MSWSNKQIIYSILIIWICIKQYHYWCVCVCVLPSSEFCWLAMWTVIEAILWRLIQHGQCVFRQPVNSPTSPNCAAILIKVISVNNDVSTYFKLSVSLQLSQHDTQHNVITHGKTYLYHLERFVEDNPKHGRNSIAHNKDGQVFSRLWYRGKTIGIYVFFIYKFYAKNLYSIFFFTK